MMGYVIHSAETNIWNGFMRSLTIANVFTLFVWLGVVLYNQSINIFLWLIILAIGFTITFTGWLIDRVWYRFHAKCFKNPFSIVAYLSRVPYYGIISGSTAITVLSLAMQINIINALEYSPYFIVVIFVYQIFYQWIMYNRIRKFSLIQI
jgi:hypothetical protein